MHTYFGQFITFDLAASSPTGPTVSYLVPGGDPYYDLEEKGTVVMNFSRTSAASGTGAGTGQPKRHRNGSTSYLDVSDLYCSSWTTLDSYYDPTTGKINPNVFYTPTSPAFAPLVPNSFHRAGDARMNKNPRTRPFTAVHLKFNSPQGPLSSAHFTSVVLLLSGPDPFSQPVKPSSNSSSWSTTGG